MNIVVSDPKTGKAYSINTDAAVFIGKKIGDEVELTEIGLEGYKGKITGGTDKDGFPMRPSIKSMQRVSIVLSGGPGIRKLEKGQRKKKTVRGAIVAQDIQQLNIVITAYGKKKLEEILGKKEKEEGTKEEKEEKQEQAEREPKVKEKEKKAKEEKKEANESEQIKNEDEQKAKPKAPDKGKEG
ncbi:MAG: 30S ribosomal protein S6e [Candidatus Diapherotrites archaeon]|nr:30S ribosomal protein S6e [Candidatus Diapherotrites archaeon]